MTLHQFIFSNQVKHRLARHFTFWLSFAVHFTIQSLLIGGPGEARTSRTFLQGFIHFLYFLPIYFFSTYLFIEIIIPKFLYPRRKTAFLVAFFVLFCVNFILVYSSGAIYLHKTKNLPYSRITLNANKYHAVVNGIFVPFMLLGIAAGIKFSKNWYLQRKENEKLVKQKLTTELQLFKTSLHPKFLFHSLQTVKRHIDISSDQSPHLIVQLSDLLSYILYEKDETWVPVEKELEIISSYINLEEKSFGDQRLFSTTIPENTEGKFIVPFILLSIVEDCFEYFFETGQHTPSLKLSADIHENTLHFQLFFSRAADSVAERSLPDTKLFTLQKQLQAQYAGLHQLDVIPGGETISIDLKLPLYSGDVINTKRNLMMNEAPALV